MGVWGRGFGLLLYCGFGGCRFVGGEVGCCRLPFVSAAPDDGGSWLVTKAESAFLVLSKFLGRLPLADY